MRKITKKYIIIVLCKIQDIISGIDLILPPVEAQKDYIAFASQLDKSKYVAQKTTQILQYML